MEKEKQKKNEEEMKIKKLEEDRKKLVLSGWGVAMVGTRNNDIKVTKTTLTTTKTMPKKPVITTATTTPKSQHKQWQTVTTTPK